MIISGGLDKMLYFWTIEEQQNRDIFSITPVIQENDEIFIDQQEQTNVNMSSLTNVPSYQNDIVNPRNKPVLIRKEKIKTDRVIEIKMSPDRKDECFMLLANNKQIAHMDISTRTINTKYIQENQDIMTFCINPRGTLIITSLIGAFPCFHLWMIDHQNYVGENPFKMFSNRKFYWKTSKLIYKFNKRTQPIHPNCFLHQ